MQGRQGEDAEKVRQAGSKVPERRREMKGQEGRRAHRVTNSASRVLSGAPSPSLSLASPSLPLPLTIRAWSPMWFPAKLSFFRVVLRERPTAKVLYPLGVRRWEGEDGGQSEGERRGDGDERRSL